MMTDEERITEIYQAVAPVATSLAPGPRVLGKVQELVEAILETRADYEGPQAVRANVAHRAELTVSMLNIIVDWEDECVPGEPVLSAFLTRPDNRPMGHKFVKWATRREGCQ